MPLAYQIQYLIRKCLWHILFKVRSHLQISDILQTLIKLENNYVLDE